MSYPIQWTPAVKSAFLAALAETGEVLAVCDAVNLSSQGAYRHRALDPDFARGWDVAMRTARHVVADRLTSRALHGWSEEMFYRGELVGHRQRHDNRLILALMARLDKQYANEEQDRRAARAEPHLARIIADVAEGKSLEPHFAPTPEERAAELIARVEQRRAYDYCAPLMTREEREWAEGLPLLEDKDWSEDEDWEGDEDEKEEQGVDDSIVAPPPEPGPLPAEHETAFSPPRGHHSSSLLNENNARPTPETDPKWRAELVRLAALRVARLGSDSFNRDDPPGGPRIRSL